MCARNRRNRAKQVIKHTAGTKSFARIRAELTSKDPDKCEPTEWKMVLETHKRRDESIIDPGSEEIISKVQTLSNQVGGESSNSTVEDEIFLQVIGPERHGRVRGYGLGPTPTFVSGSFPSRANLMRQVEEANKRLESIKIDMAEKMVEMERKMEMFMEEMRSKMIPGEPQNPFAEVPHGYREENNKGQKKKNKSRKKKRKQQCTRMKELKI